MTLCPHKREDIKRHSIRISQEMAHGGHKRAPSSNADDSLRDVKRPADRDPWVVRAKRVAETHTGCGDALAEWLPHADVFSEVLTNCPALDAADPLFAALRDELETAPQSSEDIVGWRHGTLLYGLGSNVGEGKCHLVVEAHAHAHALEARTLSMAMVPGPLLDVARGDTDPHNGEPGTPESADSARDLEKHVHIRGARLCRVPTFVAFVRNLTFLNLETNEIVRDAPIPDFVWERLTGLMYFEVGSRECPDDKRTPSRPSLLRPCRSPKTCATSMRGMLRTIPVLTGAFCVAYCLSRIIS